MIKTCNNCKAYSQNRTVHGYGTYEHENTCKLGIELERLPKEKWTHNFRLEITYCHKPIAGICRKPMTNIAFQNAIEMYQNAINIGE